MTTVINGLQDISIIVIQFEYKCVYQSIIQLTIMILYKWKVIQMNHNWSIHWLTLSIFSTIIPIIQFTKFYKIVLDIVIYEML